MIFRKEKIYDLRIGKVSAHTLRENKALVLNAYDSLINDLSNKEKTIIRRIVDNIEHIILEAFGFSEHRNTTANMCGERLRNALMNFNNDIRKDTDKFLKKYQFNKPFGLIVKEIIELDKIINERKLINDNKFHLLKSFRN